MTLIFDEKFIFLLIAVTILIQGITGAPYVYRYEEKAKKTKAGVSVSTRSNAAPVDQDSRTTAIAGSPNLPDYGSAYTGRKGSISGNVNVPGNVEIPVNRNDKSNSNNNNNNNNNGQASTTSISPSRVNGTPVISVYASVTTTVNRDGTTSTVTYFYAPGQRPVSNIAGEIGPTNVNGTTIINGGIVVAYTSSIDVAPVSPVLTNTTLFTGCGDAPSFMGMVGIGKSRLSLLGIDLTWSPIATMSSIMGLLTAFAAFAL